MDLGQAAGARRRTGDADPEPIAESDNKRDHKAKQGYSGREDPRGEEQKARSTERAGRPDQAHGTTSCDYEPSPLRVQSVGRAAARTSRRLGGGIDRRATFLAGERTGKDGDVAMHSGWKIERQSPVVVSGANQAQVRATAPTADRSPATGSRIP